MTSATTLSPIQEAVRTQLEKVFTREVIRVPLSGPDNLPSPHYGLCFDDAVGREDWMRCTVKQGYIPHTREDVAVLAETVAAGLDLPLEEVKISAHFKRGKGHRVAVQPTTKYRKELHNAPGDTLWPKFIINANYGGSFTAQCGMYRDACSNMQMMRRVEHTTVSLRHVGNFRDNFDDTVQQWQSLSAKFDNIVEAAAHMRDTQVKATDFFHELYPQPSEADPVSKHKRHKEKLTKMLDRIIRERNKLGDTSTDYTKCNLWELVNSVTGFVQHDKRKTRDGKKLTATQKAFLAIEDKECDRAWDYAFDNLVAA